MKGAVRSVEEMEWVSKQVRGMWKSTLEVLGMVNKWEGDLEFL